MDDLDLLLCLEAHGLHSPLMRAFVEIGLQPHPVHFLRVLELLINPGRDLAPDHAEDGAAKERKNCADHELLPSARRNSRQNANPAPTIAAQRSPARLFSMIARARAARRPSFSIAKRTHRCSSGLRQVA
jgi:hypothetical protein